MVDINVRPRPKALWVLASDRRWRIRDIQGSTAESILIQEIRKLVMSGSETGTVYRLDGTLLQKVIARRFRSVLISRSLEFFWFFIRTEW